MPAAELLAAKSASVHWVRDSAWIAAPRWQGLLLHTLQRVADDVAAGTLVPPPVQLVEVPPVPLGATAADIAAEVADALMVAAAAGNGVGLPGPGTGGARPAALTREPAQVAGVRLALQRRHAAALWFEGGRAGAVADSEDVPSPVVLLTCERLLES